MSGDARRNPESANGAAANAPRIGGSLVEILTALLKGRSLSVVVPIALARVEHEPLVRAAHFHGDLMRALMEVPGAFWGRHPPLYDRYREALRRSAALRRRLPVEERMRFWSPLPTSHASDERGE